ncbi:MAG: sel1 repeat family protein [Bernardetiaceae bacterium]|nr:sel1 repeat family protein [Bernardetiaceae bacterium]
MNKKIKSTILLIVLLSLSLSLLDVQQIFAQPMAERKAARKGDVEAMRSLANYYRGGMFGGDTHYKKAKKWALKAVKQDKKNPHGNRGELLLFKIHLIGDAKLPPNSKQARLWLQKAAQADKLIKRFPDKPDLNLNLIIELQKRALSGHADSQVQFARTLLHFGIDYQMAMANLEKAKAQNHSEAEYLIHKWSYIAKNTKLLQDANPKIPTDKIKPYTDKSTIAKLEYAYNQIQNQKMGKNELIAIETLLLPFLRDEEADIEVRIKVLAILQRIQSDKKRLQTLDILDKLAANYNISDYPFIRVPLEEYAIVREAMQSFKGFAGITQKYEGLKTMGLDSLQFEEYYFGNIEGLCKDYKSINQKENAEFIGTIRLQQYESEFKSIIGNLIERAHTLEQLLQIEAAFNEESWLKPIYSAHKTRLYAKIYALGVDVEDLNYLIAKTRMEKIGFKSLSEGRAYLPVIAQLDNLSEAQKDKLKQDLIRKTIKDSYKNPNEKQLAQLYDSLAHHTWLGGLGMDTYFNLKHNSDNNFRGYVEVRNKTYMYEVKRQGRSNNYDLSIMAVIRGSSNLAYKSKIEVRIAEDAPKHQVNIALAEPKGYSWIVAKNEYIQARVAAPENNLQVKEVGSQWSNFRVNSGINESEISRLEVPNEYEMQNTVRTALKYFIVKYNRLMRY